MPENNFNVELILKTLTDFPLIFNHLLYALTLSVTIIELAVPDNCSLYV